MRILVTGATGYVGGRLVPRLLAQGYGVRCLVRDRSRLQGRSWLDAVETMVGDVAHEEDLDRVLSGIDVAYYLVHSMAGGPGYRERDLSSAASFGERARAAGVQRIIYLGGLGDPDADLSEHLRSRHETAEALRRGGVPVTEFRAAVIVGSGSLSFEMIRYLAERVPVMICPRWVYTRTQPIAIRNVLDYLVAALETPASVGQIVQIGGRDVMSYGEMMLGYARARGLTRRLLPVPVLTPRLSSYWVHLVSPIPSAIARPLILGLRNEAIVRDDSARRIFPEIETLDYRQAVERALGHLQSGTVETAWTDALVSTLSDGAPVVLGTQEGLIYEHRQRRSPASARRLFEEFSALGGSRGWPAMNWAWQVRGWIDRLAGGVGMRRGRRHPTELRVGEAVDFWRVEALEPDRLLRLRAEMKLPGRAWLQFQVTPQEDGSSLLQQTAFFAPKGLLGLIYWYGLYPIHGFIFSAMIRRLGLGAECQ